MLLFCAFLALRSEDNKTPVERIRDYEIHREEELFAGSVSGGPCVSDPRLTQRRRIVDDHYEHALRMFQEKDTGVIRLQASVQTGECKRQVDRSIKPCSLQSQPYQSDPLPENPSGQPS